MRIATAFYDERNILVYPHKFAKTESRNQDKLTTAAGYWHMCLMYFDDDYSRNAALYGAIKAVHETNGTVFRVEADNIRDGHKTQYYFKMLYVIEEANRSKCTEFAASAMRSGISPNFTYPFDEIAEYGSDWTAYPDNARRTNSPLNFGPAREPGEPFSYSA